MFTVTIEWQKPDGSPMGESYAPVPEPGDEPQTYTITIPAGAGRMSLHLPAEE